MAGGAPGRAGLVCVWVLACGSALAQEPLPDELQAPPATATELPEREVAPPDAPPKGEPAGPHVTQVTRPAAPTRDAPPRAGQKTALMVETLLPAVLGAASLVTAAALVAGLWTGMSVLGAASLALPLTGGDPDETLSGFVFLVTLPLLALFPVAAAGGLAGYVLGRLAGVGLAALVTQGLTRGRSSLWHIPVQVLHDTLAHALTAVLAVVAGAAAGVALPMAAGWALMCFPNLLCFSSLDLGGLGGPSSLSLQNAGFTGQDPVTRFAAASLVGAANTVFCGPSVAAVVGLGVLGAAGTCLGVLSPWVGRSASTVMQERRRPVADGVLDE